MKKETLEALENAVLENITKSATLEEGSKGRKELVDEGCDILDRLLAIEKYQLDACNKEDCFKLEEQKHADMMDLERAKLDQTNELEDRKSETMLRIEREKDTISKTKMWLEIAKIVVPTVVPMIAYGVYQKRMLKFEEEGRITSSAGKDLHLPKFFK